MRGLTVGLKKDRVEIDMVFLFLKSLHMCTNQP